MIIELSKVEILRKVRRYLKLNGIEIDKKFYKYLNKLAFHNTKNFRISYKTLDKSVLIVNTYTNELVIKVQPFVIDIKKFEYKNDSKFDILNKLDSFYEEIYLDTNLDTDNILDQVEEIDIILNTEDGEIEFTKDQIKAIRNIYKLPKGYNPLDELEFKDTKGDIITDGEIKY